jgi:hypothetical protein
VHCYTALPYGLIPPLIKRIKTLVSYAVFTTSRAIYFLRREKIATHAAFTYLKIFKQVKLILFRIQFLVLCIPTMRSNNSHTALVHCMY